MCYNIMQNLIYYVCINRLGGDMESAEKVLKQIIKLQNDNGYSDQQMADKIGCSRPLYQRTRTSKIPMGGTFIKGAMKLLETMWNEARKAISPHTLESTDGSFHRSSHYIVKSFVGIAFPSFVTGLFCNNRV